MKKLKVFIVNPIGKPRMTQRDKWKKRKCVESYYQFKDLIVWQKGGFVFPDSGAEVIFHIAMPDSWSLLKKREHIDKPHQQTPDIDNLIKALFDALMVEDKNIWNITATKYWSGEGKIEIYY